MKKIIFSKFSNERAKRFAIRTDILLDETGVRTVRKTAAYPEGKEHVNRIPLWEKRLSDQFAGAGLCVNQVLSCEDGQVEFAFLEDTQVLEEQIAQLYKKGRKEESFALLMRALDLLRSCASVPFAHTEPFAEVFGNRSLPEGLLCMPVTDLDMTAENLLLRPGDAKWHLIDYEWTFDFPIPVDFLIYRFVRYFFFRNFASLGEKVELFYEMAGIRPREQAVYAKMEDAFQDYVTGGHVPVRDLYADISPGCLILQQTDALKNGSDLLGDSTIVTTLYLFSDASGKNFHEIQAKMKREADGSFAAEFAIDPETPVQRMRWDPVEGRMCHVRIREVLSDKNRALALVPDNGFPQDGAHVFWTFDPVYQVIGDFRGMKKLVIRGEIQFLDAAAKIEELRARAGRLDAAEQKIAAIEASKGYRVLEKMRRLRNRIKHWLARLADRLTPKSGADGSYHAWYMRHCAQKGERSMQRAHVLPFQPKISLLACADNVSISPLRAMMDSVLAQSYENWELLVTEKSGAQDMRALLDEYARRDARIRPVYPSAEQTLSNGRTAALPFAAGDFAGFLDGEDLLAPEALYETALAMQDPMADVIYTDEDSVDAQGKRYADPLLKPDFSPDLLRSYPYIGHLLLVRKSLLDLLTDLPDERSEAADYALALRCTECARNVRHVAKILYHKRQSAEQPQDIEQLEAQPQDTVQLRAFEDGKKVLEAHISRMGLTGEVRPAANLPGAYHVSYRPEGSPLVSVIIPNRDHTEDLDRCIRSILDNSTYRNLEIVVVENNSQEEGTFPYYEKIRSAYPQVRTVVWDGPFNFSAINNFGAQSARGDYLLFLNNDTDLIAPDSIGEMAGMAARPDVGIVGAKLLYADGTVQHAGIVYGIGGFAEHIFHGMAGDAPGYMGRAAVTGNVSAVTGACMMMRREVFEAVGGFPEEYPIAVNDVELCMRIGAAGYRIVFQPEALWHHYESKSRGYEDTPEKRERLMGEIGRFRERWGAVVDAGDPYYNPNFSREKTFELRP